MPLTIYDISKKANVSIATVSRVLNGNSNVKESTRKKVMAVVEEYDYTPNAYARAMSMRSLKTIGILCADCSDPYMAKALFYLEQELHANGYESLLCNTGYNWDIKQNYINLILSKKIDGLILVGSNFIGTTEEENRYIMESAGKVPIMLMNAALDHPNVYSTLCDDCGTMLEVTDTMIESGISDILYLYDAKSYSGRMKIKGFEESMKKHGILDYEGLMYFYDGNINQMDAIADFVENIAKSGKRFHGVLAADDALAIGAIKYARRVGRSIPEDLSVVGYNNSMLTSCCTPELTSVDNCLGSLTHQLVCTLIGVLSGEEMPKKSVFSGKLVSRGTTNF